MIHHPTPSSDSGQICSADIERYRESISIHMDHYGGNRLPYACISASGVRQRLARLDGPEAGRLVDVVDASGGYASACLGAGHPVVSQSLAETLLRAGYVTDEVGSNERASFLHDFFGSGGCWADRFPPSDYHVCSRNSGSEGMELALRLVLESNWDYRRMRPSAGRESRRGLLAFEGAWHGWTAGVQSLLNRRHYRVGLPDGLSEGQHGLTTHFLPFGEIGLLEDFFSAQGHGLAAAVVEPVQGDAGILVPPPCYLRTLANLCRKYDVWLVADEVLTFAKTGQFFAMDDDGPISTDITVVGKSLGLGVIPVSLVIARRELQIRSSGAVSTNDLRPLTSGLIHAGMSYIAQNGLLEQSRHNGEQLRHELCRIVDDFPHVFTDARGLGVLHGLELSERAAQSLAKFRMLLVENGVFAEFMAGAGRRSCGLRYLFPALRVAPPLVATDKDLEEIVRSIRLAAKQLQENW